MVHNLVVWDENGNQDSRTAAPVLIDGGTEGFRGHARVISPFRTACFECTIGLIPKDTAYNSCTLAVTPRIPEHCIAYIIEDAEKKGIAINTDSLEDITWVYKKALERSKEFRIEGVTYKLTLGVVKKIIPAIASTNALIAAACCNEALKIYTGCS
jgi:ubiquitin-activating enzyme E1 C